MLFLFQIFIFKYPFNIGEILPFSVHDICFDFEYTLNRQLADMVIDSPLSPTLAEVLLSILENRMQNIS